jgi:hypothetical protein
MDCLLQSTHPRSRRTNKSTEQITNRPLQTVDERSSALCIINAGGTVQMANKVSDEA